ncbi:twin transmembrane helix small protein [Rhodospirillaceae bacterium AH-315-P19]|nr:twin transmembrane helix small protein [Rhodospirillaceae bacterium AH-315-P19]
MAGLIEILPYLVGLALFATLAILVTGIVTMIRGGKFNAKHSNTLMRWRVFAQGVAVALFVLMLFLTMQD